MPYTIPDLNPFPGLPTGNELAETSSNPGSYKLPISVLAYGRLPNNVTSSSTFNLAANNYGDVLVKVNGAVTVQLPDSTLRLGVPVSVVDIGGYAASENILILPYGVQTILGQAQVQVTSNYGAWTLWPISTGGWYIK